MKGALTIDKVQTRFDYEVLNEDDKKIFRKFLKGTIYRQVDTRSYPEDYWDQNLQEGDEGYLAPILEDVKDLSTLERFGLTEEEVQ